MSVRQLTLLLCVLMLTRITVSADDAVRFNRDVRPILTENCFHCHGPDPGTRKAGLRFDRKEFLFGKIKDGSATVVVPGKPTESDLYRRVVTTDADDLMPPPESHHELTAGQKDLLKRWIEQGASWEPHWAFIAPTKPTPPAVKDAAWVRNPIDAFVAAKLESNGLTHNPEADKRALIRRLALDLTGLPPAVADVEAFVANASPDAYEKLVDKYLASPQYGEHRARYWLDAARYADTHGLHFDNYREMWPYRDWVMNAFNTNKPFDQFTVEQLAGDLLPNRTLDQEVASGFMRCGMTTNEGGTIAEENLVFYAQDRTETAARVWLGLTMNCAVCHDHKFDPVSQKDFYSMSAFFNNITMGALDGNVKDTAPSVVVPRMEERAQWNRLHDQLVTARAARAARRGEATADFTKWLASDEATPKALLATVPVEGLQLRAPLSEGKGTETRYFMKGVPTTAPVALSTWVAGGNVATRAVRVEKASPVEFASAGDFERDQPFTAAAWIKLPGPNATGAILSRMDDRDNYRGWDLWAEGGRIGSHVIHHWDDDAFKVVTDKPLEAKKWHHVAISYDGSGKAAGMKVYVDGVAQSTRTDRDALKGSIRTTAPMKIGQRMSASPLPNLVVQDVRVYERALAAPEAARLATATRLAHLLAKPADKRTPDEQNELFETWLGHLDEPSRALVARAEDLERQIAPIDARGATTLVMAEKPTPAVAYVLYRGAYDQRRDEVKAMTPSSLPKFGDDVPANRLGLAKWFVRADNPLTARVTVNRFWQEIFGQGIVRTADDFGVMGEAPINQPLLDWLAVDFRENGWDVKRLMKEIVTSATYRQSAAATPLAIEKDPGNRLLSRGPRFRMDGEMVRDEALAASGLLVANVGGPSARPYQPPGVWEAIAMPGSTTRDYVQDHGDGLYRRSVYTFWKRAAPPASLEVFNAPSREGCTVRRERTDTPMQALVTMNDTQFVEAARALAEKAIKQGGTFEARLGFMTERLTSRTFAGKELAVCKSTFDDLDAYYKSHADDAKNLLAVGESKRDASIDPATHAAWTMLANQLMNLDEVLNK